MKFTLTKAKNLQHSIQSILGQVKLCSGKVCLLVPDKLSVTLERKLFEYLQIESSFDIEIYTLTRYSNKILTELEATFTPISKLGSVVLLKKILTDNIGNLKVFNTNSFSYNYADSLFKTLTQFKASQISYNDMQDGDIKSAQLRNKIDDLSIILEQYEQEKSGLLDQCDVLNLFALNIHKSETIKNTNFFFLGFDNFTSQGYTVIEQLIKNALSVNVAIYENNLNANFLSDVKEHLQAMVLKNNLPLTFYEQPFKTDSIHNFMADNLFSNNKQNMLLNETISLKNAKSFSEEIEFVARDIRTKILNGAKYKNFGIACFDLEKYSALISNYMYKYDLNYYIDTSVSLNNTFIYKFVVNYIKIFLKYYDVNNVIQLINSNLINFSSFTKLNVNKVLKEIGYFPHTLTYFDDESKKLVSFVLDLLEKFSLDKNTNLSLFREIINNLLIYLNYEEILYQTSEKIQDNYQKKILSQELSAFNSLLDEIENFYPNINLEDLLEIIENAGKDVKINPIPQSLDCIQIIDANEILTDFDNLYIVNCNHSTCPAIMQDVGIILDSDINNLPFSKKLAPTISYLNRLAKLKMFNSVQMFNNSLTITMSVYNESEISDLVKELQKRFFCETTTGYETEIYDLPLTSITDDEHRTILSKWDLIEFLSQNSYSLTQDILNFYNINKYQNTPYLNDNSKHLLNFKQISCSALENYFKCPMNFFLSNILKLEVERANGIAMVDVGNMLHLLAKDFYDLANRNTVDVEKFCKTKLIQYMNNDKKLATFIDSSVHLNLIGEAIRFINRLKYMDEYSKFIPTFFEYEFDNQFNKSIQIGEDVFLRGKIDRIDFFENYIRILDYKTGEVNASLKELYYGKKLQLFMYAKLASEIFDKQIAGSFYFPIKNSILNQDETSKYKLSGFYVNERNLATAFDTRIEQTLKSDLLSLALNKDGEIKQDARSTKILTRTNFEKLMNYSLALSSNAIKQIKQGYVLPSPIKFDEQSNSCTYCPYLSICRKNSMNIPYRTTQDVNLNSFGGNNG